jgi:hypothetical protein
MAFLFVMQMKTEKRIFSYKKEVVDKAWIRYTRTAANAFQGWASKIFSAFSTSCPNISGRRNWVFESCASAVYGIDAQTTKHFATMSYTQIPALSFLLLLLPAFGWWLFHKQFLDEVRIAGVSTDEPDKVCPISEGFQFQWIRRIHAPFPF